MAATRPKCPDEHTEQALLFRMVALQVPRYPELERLFAIPNGGARHPAVAGKLRAEGVKSGVPDLCLPWPCGGFHGLYVEMKRRQGSYPTRVQRDWLDWLSAQGYATHVCRGADEAFRVILDYVKQGGDAP